MKYGPATCRKNLDLTEDLEIGIEQETDQTEKINRNAIPPSPHLLVKINHSETWALIDTGSQVTAISETFYEKIKDVKKFHELPVSSIVATAIGKKGTSVEKQVLFDFFIRNYCSSFIFLVIPYISCEFGE